MDAGTIVANVFTLGLPLAFLRMIDAGWVHPQQLEAVALAIMYAIVGADFLGACIHNLLTGDTAQAVFNCMAAVIYFIIAWELWKRRRPPRKRKRRIQTALRRIGHRLIPVPVTT